MIILQILGCLGIFLFGMKVLSEGIQKTAGEGMRKIMATMTTNRFAGVGTGFLTTCLLQSSSATTVIVVSFVNASLLTLVESIGVIMGANLGTTITAWIIAAVGKFSLAKIAIPIIGIGMPLLFIGKVKAKSFGEILVGFGLLFFGLGLLKDAVPDVKGMLASADPAVKAQATEWLERVKGLSGYGYGSLLIFLFGGVILTLIVQSSSAAMAITVTMAMAGWIGFNESCAIVLGENIGTTVTAWLASLGANTSAKRAARAHFVFNVMGVIWMLIVFYAFTGGVQWLGEHLPESFRSEHASDIGFNLAIFHTSFNLLNILFLIGFVPLIARVVTKWVKDTDDETGGRQRLKFISQSFVDVGELNLPEAENEVREMGKVNREMMDTFMQVLDNPTSELESRVEKLAQLEDDCDVMMHGITEYLVRCSTNELSDAYAANISGMLRIVAEFEEISDCQYHLGKLMQRKVDKGHDLSSEVIDGIREHAATVSEFIDFNLKNLFAPISATDIKDANKLENLVDEHRQKFNKAAMMRMQDKGDIKAEMLNIDMSNQLEKMGNHALNVMEAAHEMSGHPRH
jgi:phosphate:Na+ symporter